MQSYIAFANRVCAQSISHTCLVIDVSGTMGADDWKPTRLEGAVEAARAFLNVKCEQYPDDQLAVITFGSHAHTAHSLIDVKSGSASLRSAIGNLGISGSTNMTAGLARAHEMLTGKYINTGPTTIQILGKLSKWFFEAPASPPPCPPRPPSTPIADGISRQVVLLSDGHNTACRSPVKVAKQMKDEGIEIDVVGIGGSALDVDEDELRAIASTDASGRPRYCFIGDKSKLIEEFKRLANRIEPL